MSSEELAPTRATMDTQPMEETGANQEVPVKEGNPWSWLVTALCNSNYVLLPLQEDRVTIGRDANIAIEEKHLARDKDKCE